MLSFLRLRLMDFRGSRFVIYPLSLFIILPLMWKAYERFDPLNGFDVSQGSIVAEAITGGGPGRDDIPALTDPEMLAADESNLAPDARVLGLVVGGEARAFPLNIMNWHEIVNIRVADRDLVVSWCPLCSTGLAFYADRRGERLLFGVSGLLYQDNLLMYDRQTRSLWAQLQGEAVSGSLTGETLVAVPLAHTRFGPWLDKHPNTLVLSPDTGHSRSYDLDPYADYHQQARNMPRFPGLNPYERVIGVRVGADARAYPFAELAQAGNSGTLDSQLGGRDFSIRWDAVDMTYDVTSASGNEGISSTISYWFAWQNFYPETQVYTDEETGQPNQKPGGT